MNLQSLVSAMEYYTNDFRRKLKADHNIDHIVELQIIVAVLLENKISQFSTVYSDFTNYFNKLWNLKFITKKENKEKSRNVLTYICWKFGVIEEVNDDVFQEISDIYKFYNKNRPKVRGDLKSLEENHLKIEKSLFNFLDKDKEKPARISIVDFIIKSKALEKKYSNLYNIDHVVEIQILAFVLTENKVDSDDLKLKFVKYFHQDWNFQILTKKENISKGHAVKQWIKLIIVNSKSCSVEICEMMKLIFDRYRKNISKVKRYIQNDEINEAEKKKLIELVDYLNNLFENNITFDL